MQHKYTFLGDGLNSRKLTCVGKGICNVMKSWYVRAQKDHRVVGYTLEKRGAVTLQWRKPANTSSAE